MIESRTSLASDRAWRAGAAFAALALLPLISSGPSGFGIVAGALTAGFVVAGRFDAELSQRRWVMVAFLGVAGAVVGPRWYQWTAYHAIAVGLALVGVALVRLADSRPRRARRVAVALSLLALGLALANDPGGMLDVALMHRAGSEALLNGDSPWVGLGVPSGVPGSDHDMVVDGDPYPPVALLSYLLFDVLTGEPRAAGAFAWLVLTIAVWFIPARDPRPLILLTTSASLPLLLWTGWTELVTLALLATVVAIWQRKAVVSSVVMGLALASKQYMVVVAPLLLALRDRQAALRRWVTAAVAAGAAASGFLLGEGYFDAIVGAYIDFEPRRDSASLLGLLAALGLEPALPSWIGPAVAILVCMWLARKGVPGVESLLTITAKSLAILFALGTQAFSNYWFLVFALLLLAMSRPTVRREHDA